MKRTIELPCDINDLVYTLGVKRVLETLLTAGEVIPRTVDEIIINSRGIEIHSKRTSEDDNNFYGYIGETVFLTKQEAEEKLKKLKEQL